MNDFLIYALMFFGTCYIIINVVVVAFVIFVNCIGFQFFSFYQYVMDKIKGKNILYSVGFIFLVCPTMLCEVVLVGVGMLILYTITLTKCIFTRKSFKDCYYDVRDNAYRLLDF